MDKCGHVNNCVSMYTKIIQYLITIYICICVYTYMHVYIYIYIARATASGKFIHQRSQSMFTLCRTHYFCSTDRFDKFQSSRSRFERIERMSCGCGRGRAWQRASKSKLPREPFLDYENDTLKMKQS